MVKYRNRLLELAKQTSRKLRTILSAYLADFLIEEKFFLLLLLIAPYQPMGPSFYIVLDNIIYRNGPCRLYIVFGIIIDMMSPTKLYK